MVEEGEREEEGPNVLRFQPPGMMLEARASLSAHSPPTLLSKLSQAVLAVPFYPIRFVGVLVQLGHEPVGPQRRYSLVFRRYMYYWPGLIGYARAVAKKDGWRELYRGAGAGIASDVIAILATSALDPLIGRAVRALPLSIVPSNGDQPDNEDNVQTTRAVAVRAVRIFVRQICLKTALIIIIQPFYTVSVRMIAQHVGKEAIYTSVWTSFREIWREEGIGGFYKGTVPALLGGAVTALMYTSLWMGIELIANMCPQEWMKAVLKTMVGPFTLSYVPSSNAYPFTLMRTMLAVNNSRLAAGSPPHVPIFHGWRDCHRYLKRNNLMYRGSVIFLPRYAYTTPP